MVKESDIEVGFAGYCEYPAIDAAYRALCEDAVRAVADDALLESREFRGELTLVVKKEIIHALCLRLRDDPELRFDYFIDVTAVDFLNLAREPRFDAVYHLYSIPKNRRLRIHCPIEEEQCRIDSVTDIWTAANWNERECYDFYGIVFDGHPNLERILLPEDWEGWPMRKDFPLGGTKSFYFKKDTGVYTGEPKDLVPRIRKEISDI